MLVRIISPNAFFCVSDLNPIFHIDSPHYILQVTGSDLWVRVVILMFGYIHSGRDGNDTAPESSGSSHKQTKMERMKRDYLPQGSVSNSR